MIFGFYRLLAEVLGGEKDSSSVGSDYLKISEDLYSYFRRNDFLKSFSYMGLMGEN
jgi:hypothetical protein